MQLHLRRSQMSITVTPWSSQYGGEGYMCEVNGRPDQCAKVYRDPIPGDLGARLEYLIDHGPATIFDRVAWPQDIAEDGAGRVVGYLQRRFGAPYTGLFDVIPPLVRPSWATAAVMRQIAHEVAHLTAELHADGYLYPDLHSGQFLVAPQQKTVLIDAASVQFQHAGHFYACDKVRAEYQGPEFNGTANWSNVADQRDVYTDAYSLAVLQFQLAMGCHPFDGIYIGTGQSLTRAERAQQGQFPFDKACRDYRPPKGAPPYDMVRPELRDLFQRCFVEGHRYADRTRRPSAADWAIQLRQCSTLHMDSTRPQPAATTRTPRSIPAAVAATLFIAGCGLGFGLARLGDSRLSFPAHELSPFNRQLPGISSGRIESLPPADPQAVINRIRSQIPRPSQERKP